MREILVSAALERSAGARVVDAYTPFNLPRTMRVQGVSAGFEYDAFGTRVRKSSGTDETVYVGGLYERRMASLVRTHVYSVQVDGRTVAEVRRTSAPSGGVASSTLYLHHDRLGSVDVVTNEAGAVVQRFKYGPFGERRNPNAVGELSGAFSPATRKGYTGHEMDDELRLINMRGRMYDAGIARF
ncbi:MAG: RHS repeat domain-containing protein [Myxococcota bacterium]